MEKLLNNFIFLSRQVKNLSVITYLFLLFFVSLKRNDALSAPIGEDKVRSFF
jgi:hypothetical protein